MANSVVINYLVKVAGVKDVETLKAKLTNLTTSKGFQSAVMGVGISAGMAAWSALGSVVRNAGDYIGDAIKVAMEEDAQIRKMSTALAANATAWDGNVDAVESNIDALKRLSFSDDQMRDSLTRLIPVTHDTEQAFRVMRTAMDLARLRGIDLVDASDKIGKALVGNKRVLKELGIVVDANADSTEILSEIQRVAAGQADAYATTMAGAADRIGNAWQDLSEDAGRQFLTWADDAARAIGLIAYNMQTGNTEMEKYAEHLLRVEAVAKGDVPTLMALGDSVSEITASARASAGPINAFADDTEDATDSAAELEDQLKRAKDAWDLLNGRIKTNNEFANLPDQITVAAAEVETAQSELNAAIAKGNAAAIAAARIRLRDAGAELDTLRRRFAQLRLEIGRVIRVGSVGTGVGTGIQPRAAGGTVWGGSTYLVGERGPELFVPQTTGTIVPNGVRAAPVNVAVYLDSDQIAARVERRQYFAASVAPVSAR